MIWNQALIWALLPLAAALEWRVQAVQRVASSLARAPVRPDRARALSEAANTRALRAER